MKTLLKIIQYLFLIFTILISLNMSILSIIILLIPFIKINILYILLSGLFFIPTIGIIIIFITAQKYNGKHPKIIKTLLYILILLALFIQPYLYVIPTFSYLKYLE